jgi:hypothetical protein
MNTIQRRILYFLVGCVGSRILITLLAKNIDNKYLPILGYIALIPAVGFLYIYITGSRKTGIEVGGDKIWWNSLRPLHSLLYFLFAYTAINKNKQSWQILAIDVSIGLLSFIFYHSSKGSFTKMI